MQMSGQFCAAVGGLRFHGRALFALHAPISSLLHNVGKHARLGGGAQSFRTLKRLSLPDGKGDFHRSKYKKRGPSVCAPDPSTHLPGLLSLLHIFPACRGSIPFAETFPTAPIAPPDEARSQIVAPAVTADKLLCFRFALGLLCRRSSKVSDCGLSLLTIYHFRAFHFLALLQPYRLASDVCSVAPTKRAIEGDGKANGREQRDWLPRPTRAMCVSAHEEAGAHAEQDPSQNPADDHAATRSAEIVFGCRT